MAFDITGRFGSTSRKIAKALALFSSVQSITIFCGIIRAKLIAVLVGPAGTGVFSILNTLVSAVSMIIDMGLRQSAVRSISADVANRRIKSSAILLWMVAASTIAATAIFILAPQLSAIIAPGRTMTLYIRIVSVAIIFTAVAQAISAVFQGCGLLGRLAKSSILGAISGLLVTIPLLYIFKLKGVVFSIMAYSASTALFTIVFCYRKSLFDFKRKIHEYVSEYKSFLSLAMYLSVTAVITQVTFYLFMLWINSRSNTDMVGLWQAGVTVTDRYAGIIISALAVEYFPRLCRLQQSPYRLQIVCRHEVQFISGIFLVAVPLLVIISPLLMNLLYSSHYSVSTVYVIMSSIGIPLRAASFCLAYIILAKGDGKIYVGTELSSAFLYILIGTYAFKDGGIAGLGVAYTIWYLCYLLTVAFVCKFRYGINLAMRQWLTLTAAVFLSAIAGLLTLSAH